MHKDLVVDTSPPSAVMESQKCDVKACSWVTTTAWVPHTSTDRSST